MKTFRELEQELEKINEEWNEEHKKTFGPGDWYSFPRNKLKNINDQIRRQQVINCGMVCPHCGADGVHYGIEDGRYVYFCPACDSLIN